MSRETRRWVDNVPLVHHSSTDLKAPPPLAQIAQLLWYAGHVHVSIGTAILDVAAVPVSEAQSMQKLRETLFSLT